MTYDDACHHGVIGRCEQCEVESFASRYRALPLAELGKKLRSLRPYVLAQAEETEILRQKISWLKAEIVRRVEKGEN